VLVPARAWAAGTPSTISDRDYWAMIEAFSESGGAFVSDNLVSNEIAYQRVVPALRRLPRGGAYIGVGPEQNFTYIAAIHPSIAFIVDLQRSNLLLHLLYKALFETSRTRAEFVSRLFARPIGPGAGERASAASLLSAIERVPFDAAMADATLEQALTQLVVVHRFPLTDADRAGLTHIYRALSEGGPSLRGDYGGGAWIPSYAQTLTATDGHGTNRGYLASEDAFRTVQRYERANSIVPIVGDFAGGKAIRAIGVYVREHHDRVALFYTSNVEEYLFKGGTWPAFLANLAALPIDDRSTIVRAFFTHTPNGLETLSDTVSGTRSAVAAGEVTTYGDLVRRSRRR
jgi:hypothetical protein